MKHSMKRAMPNAMPRPTQTAAPRRGTWERSELIVNAEQYYGRLLRAIAGARAAVDLECYRFDLDALGRRFVDALSRAAGRGVRVRVLMDGVGSMAGGEELARRLSAAGAAVRIHNPLPWLTRSYRWSLLRGGRIYKFFLFFLNINRRNHRKLCIVDGGAAWVGSFNISAEHKQGWRDYALELHDDGKVAGLADSFDRIWTRRESKYRPANIARFLSNRSNRARRMKNRFIVRQLLGSQRRVWLVAAYFAPTAQFHRALVKACGRGRDVRVLLPEHSNVRIFPGLSSCYYRKLLESGARLFLYRPGILHAKALLVDGLAVVGSSNWNFRSTVHDLELDVLIDAPDTVAELEAAVAGDMSRSRELSLNDTPAPSIASWLWYVIRYWL